MFWKKSKSKPTPNDDLKTAKKALANNDPTHAVHHLAWILAADDTHPEALQLLSQAFASVAEPIQLVPMRENIEYPLVAVRALLYAQQGDIDVALGLMSQIYQVVEGLPFWAWVLNWVEHPAAFEIEPEGLIRLLNALREKLNSAEWQITAAGVRKIEPFIVAYATSRPNQGIAIAFAAVVLRTAGLIETALRLARMAYANAPSYMTTTILATTTREAGLLADSLVFFNEALENHETSDRNSIHLDIADTLCRMGRYEEGLTHYRLVLDEEPEHAWAYPSSLFYRGYVEKPIVWEQLQSYAQHHSDNDRATFFIRRLHPYIAFLPQPADASINVMRQVVEANAELALGPLQMAISSFEAPSAHLAITLFLQECHPETTFDVEVAELGTPDPRVPIRPVATNVWFFSGSKARPSLSAPLDVVAEAVVELARTPFNAEAWTWQAREIGRRLGPQVVRDLLGAMTYPPPRPDNRPHWDWLQQVQIAAAFLIAFCEEGWPGQARQQALFDLLFGPVDWTIGAAALALTALAESTPEALEAINAAFVERLAHHYTTYLPYSEALLMSAMQLPTITPELDAAIKRELDAQKSQ